MTEELIVAVGKLAGAGVHACWRERELGVLGEFEVAPAVVASDEPTLLESDDSGRVEGQVSFGQDAWGLHDHGEDAGGLGVQGGVGAAELVQRDALFVGQVPVAGPQAS